MKKLICFLLSAFCFQLALAQADNPNHSRIPSANNKKPVIDWNAIIKQYPVKKSSLCANCYIWVNPYYSSVADLYLKQPVVVFHLITKAHLLKSDSLKANKNTKIDRANFPFKPLPGYPDEKPVFANVNDSIKNIKLNPAFKKGDEVAEGHVASADDYSYDAMAMAFSMVHPWNLGIQWQGENVGTKLGSEYMGRDSARYAGEVYNWGGCWGTQGIKSDSKHNVKVNYPAVYWELFKWIDPKTNKWVTYAYWFPNNAAGDGQANYPNFKIPVDHVDADPKKQGLIQRLGFDPEKVLP